MKNPLVSIIIPTYNYEDYIVEAVESALNQTYSNIEVIIVDDGSSDDTKSRLFAYLDMERVIYLYQENQGLSAARNKGLQLAKGKYIQLLDSDDYLSINAIEEKVNYLENNVNVSFCYSKTINFRDVDADKRKFYSVWKEPKEVEKNCGLYFFNLAPPHAYLFKRADIFENDLWFDGSLKACEDYDFWFKLALKTRAPEFLDSPIAYYREHNESMSKKLLQQYTHDIKMLEKILDKTLSNELIENCSQQEAFLLIFQSALLTFRRIYALDIKGAAYLFDKKIVEEIIPSLKSVKYNPVMLEEFILHRIEIRKSILKVFRLDKTIDLSKLFESFESLSISMCLGLYSFKCTHLTLRQRIKLIIYDLLDLIRLIHYRSYNLLKNVKLRKLNIK